MEAEVAGRAFVSLVASSFCFLFFVKIVLLLGLLPLFLSYNMKEFCCCFLAYR